MTDSVKDHRLQRFTTEQVEFHARTGNGSGVILHGALLLLTQVMQHLHDRGALNFGARPPYTIAGVRHFSRGIETLTAQCLSVHGTDGFHAARLRTLYAVNHLFDGRDTLARPGRVIERAQLCDIVRKGFGKALAHLAPLPSRNRLGNFGIKGAFIAGRRQEGAAAFVINHRIGRQLHVA